MGKACTKAAAHEEIPKRKGQQQMNIGAPMGVPPKEPAAENPPQGGENNAGDPPA